MKFKIFFLCDPWFHSEVQGKSLATLLGLNCTLWKERLLERNKILISVNFSNHFWKVISIGNLSLEVYLGQVEADLLKMSGSNIRYSNMPKYEWDVTRSLADDKNIFKGFSLRQKRLFTWGWQKISSKCFHRQREGIF